MSPFSRKATRLMEAARPASGFRPETEAEWRKMQAAQIVYSEAMYRDMGVSRAEAKRLANLTMGGPAGRILLEIAFGQDDDE